jgi:hypothetical protein
VLHAPDRFKAASHVRAVQEIDAKTQRYRGFVAHGLDALTIERINGLIRQRRAALLC